MPESGERKKVLIVDDHADTVRVIQRLLAQQGYVVQTAQSFDGAIHASEHGPFDLLLADISLPDGDGLDLLRKIRSGGSPNARGIAFSGYGMPEDVQRSRKAGFAGHLTKPVQFDQLNQLISTILR